MTTIVAATFHGAVVMAADTMTNVYDRPMPGSAVKIRRVTVGETGEALLGFCGAGGLTNVADHVQLKDEPDVDDDEDIRKWAASVSTAINDLADTTSGQADGSMLLGWRGRLWTLANAQAIPHPDGRAALGSGEGPAIGALDALLDHTNMHTGEAVMAAARIAINRCRYSGPPIQVEWIGQPKTVSA